MISDQFWSPVFSAVARRGVVQDNYYQGYSVMNLIALYMCKLSSTDFFHSTHFGIFLFN